MSEQFLQTSRSDGGYAALYRYIRRAGCLLLGALAAFGALSGAATAQQFIPNYLVTSTVPPNGDLNPYGVWIVPPGFNSTGGTIVPGDILVANFNNKNNLAGTGTTIDVVHAGQIEPPGQAKLFWQGTTPGLNNGLVTLQAGYVLVSSLPTTDGTYATHGPGSILILNNAGNAVVNTISGGTDGINGPWDLAVVDQGSVAYLFISNIGIKTNGFVTRLKLSVTPTSVTVTGGSIIAVGYTVIPSVFAGPNGLVYDAQSGILYVASAGDNAIYAVENALTATTRVNKGTLVFQSTTALHGPLGMVQAPDGNLVVAQGDMVNINAASPSEYVEFTKAGSFVSQFNIDPAVGAAFGIATGWTTTFPQSPRLAVVNDNTATLSIFTGTPPSAGIVNR